MKRTHLKNSAVKYKTFGDLHFSLGALNYLKLGFFPARGAWSGSGASVVPREVFGLSRGGHLLLEEFQWWDGHMLLHLSVCPGPGLGGFPGVPSHSQEHDGSH